MYLISQENYDILSKMIELAKTREQLQKKFNFGAWNSLFDGIAWIDSKHGPCGAYGCLAGGYLPLVDPQRFYFFDINKGDEKLRKYYHLYHGNLMDGEKPFDQGRLFRELGQLAYDIFARNKRNGFLDNEASKADVIENCEKILARCQIKQKIKLRIL